MMLSAGSPGPCAGAGGGVGLGRVDAGIGLYPKCPAAATPEPPLSPRPTTPLPPAADRLIRHQWTFLIGGVSLLCALALSFVGLDPAAPSVAGPAAVGYVLLSSGPLALAYLLAGVGFAGPIISRWAPSSPDRAYLQAGLGVGFILWLSHLLGCVGLLSGPHGQYVGIGVIVLGLALLGVQLARVFHAKARLPAAPPLAFAVTPAIGVLLVAACNPPGGLWQSEGNGFDALSYHLPLAMEWTAGGSLKPLTHNVYSFLPSYVEAGFMHIDAVCGGGAGERANGGLIAGEAWGLMATHLTQVICTLLAGIITARVATRVLGRAGVSGRTLSAASATAFGLAVATPWAVVVGSLAYNEAAASALLAVALLACVDDTLKPAARGVIAGAAIGLATGCKPTLAFLGAPAVALALLAFTAPRAWVVMGLCAVLAGLVAFAPPLVRNYAHAGNPIFPAGTGAFGKAHWSDEQVARFAAAHAPEGTIGHRLDLLAGTSPREESLGNHPRGMMHPQWFVLFPAAAAAALLVIALPGARALGAVLTLGMLAGLAWWVLGSHNQSRFLLPLHVPGAILIALGVGVLGRLSARVPPALVGAVLLACLPLAQAIQTVRVFVNERPTPEGRTYPNAFLAGGPESLSGATLISALRTMPREQQEAVLEGLDITRYINVTLKPDDVVYLLGESGSTYAMRPVIVHSTWDASPLGDAVRATPEDPKAWARALWKRGVRYVALNPAELQRLWSTRWYDPAVTPDAVGRFISTQTEVVRDWGDALSPLAPKLLRLINPDAAPRPRNDAGGSA